ncbi:MAG: formylmethanofuran dehydrogenase [Candidatus Altiarchaeota archaeon]|nr:formylmethanofuran dehydrogenase [Candidatus Altiarchaeota archaeon]
MKFVLNTGSTLDQGIAAKGGKKMTEEYKEKAAVCFMNSADLRRLSDPRKVKVSTDCGEVVVYARQDKGIREGHVFMPRGPWANTVISSNTFETGSPFYKGMGAEVEGTEEDVLDLVELIRR